MKKNEKLFYQCYKAIEKCVCFGVDKHSYKRSNCNKVKIFSYEDRRNIIKVTSLLCDFIESNYPEIRMLKEVRLKHIQAFMDEKSNICSECTIKNYKYVIKKLEKMIRQELYLNVDFTSDLKVSNKGCVVLRNMKMEEKDIELLLTELEKSRSKARDGIVLTVLFGLRVSEICKIKGSDINIDAGHIHIHESKGKRSRDIAIENDKQKDFCLYIKNKYNDDDRICGVREDTVNAAIRRILIKSNITKYTGAKTGVHSIRKAYATKDYNSNLSVVDDNKDAWNITAEKLGHNEGRTVLKNVYVKQ